MQLPLLDSPTPSLVSSQHYHSTRSVSMESDPSPLRRQGRWHWEAPSKVASSERDGGGGSEPSKGRRHSATGVAAGCVRAEVRPLARKSQRMWALLFF